MRIALAAALLFAPLALAQEEEAPPPGLDVSTMSFSPDSIRKVMTFHQPKIQGCYEQFLVAKEKAVEGKLLTSFTVTAEGLVKNPRLLKKGTTLRDPGLNDCVVSVLTSMEFPTPPGGKEQPIEYPFNLKAIK